MEFESDETLARVIEREGSAAAQAVTVLFRRHLSRVYSLCRRYFAIREDAEEATSETFFRAFRGLTQGQFRGDARYSTWLLRIAGNTCIERLRQPRLPALSLESLTESDGAPEQIAPEASAAQKRVLEAVRLLPDDQSLALTLCDLEGYSAREAAEIMGRSTDALKSLHYRARRALRDLLKEELANEND